MSHQRLNSEPNILLKFSLLPRKVKGNQTNNNNKNLSSTLLPNPALIPFLYLASKTGKNSLHWMPSTSSLPPHSTNLFAHNLCLKSTNDLLYVTTMALPYRDTCGM